MILEQYASIAEIVGVILVIASLIYVARQLRQNTDMMRATSRNEIQHGHQKEILMLVQYPDIWRGFSNETLDDESIRVNIWLTASLRAREHEWFQFREGALDSLAWETFSKAIPLVLTSERARAWWEASKPIFDVEFSERVDELLEDETMKTVHEKQAAASTEVAGVG